MNSGAWLKGAFPKGCAVVIGGSGGLGAEICRAFAATGSSVAFSHRHRQDQATQLAQSLSAQGVRVLTQRVDLAQRDTVQSFLREAVEACGSIHTLVYAAGPLVRLDAIADVPAQELAAALQADTIGFLHAAQCAIPWLRISQGCIVALSTAGVRRHPPLDIQSTAPKASLEAIVRGIAREEGRHGIRANCVGVGHIDAGQGVSIQEDPRGRRLAERVLAATPLRRLGTAADIAHAVLFLASPLAAFVSGESLCVDGGGHV
jgi:NAD(P)-dependent dehydrogenase (short-subunit alcohol dehydrogenase family)